MHILQYIKTRTNWRQELAAAPYYLKIQDDNPYTILSYTQFQSDFRISLVRECRGLIIKEKPLQIVCRAFDKFFNYGEPYAAEIDWNTARITEKMDGSLIKIWYSDNEWHCSTNNTIDARKAPATPTYTYMDLVMQALGGISFQKACDQLDKRYCYFFELISPYNKLVITYKKYGLYYLGAREVTTWQEVVQPRPSFSLPVRSFSFSSLNAALQLDNSQEGYVVCDSKWNRIKIKGNEYLRLAHIRGNGTPSIEKLIELWQLDKLDDFCSAFPEYDSLYKEVHTIITNCYKKCAEVQPLVEKATSKKELSLLMSNNDSFARPFGFSSYEHKVSDITEFLKKMRPATIAREGASNE